jgi:hypothetical protein
MKSNNASLLDHDLLSDADADADEISCVRRTPAADLEFGVQIDEISLERAFEDPTPVYARPYGLAGGQRRDFSRGHFLGTRFLGGILVSATWEQEMREAGASNFAIAQVRRYLTSHAL